MNGRAAVVRLRWILIAILIAQTAIVAAAVAIVFGWVVAALVVVVLSWRARHVRSLERAALWIEERDPTLQYTLVTAVDPRYPGRAAPVAPGRPLRRAALRALSPAVLLLLVAWFAHTRLGHGRPERTGRRNVSAASRLTPLVAHVAPPAYSHQRAFEVKEPASIASLAGSVVTVRGPGDPAGVTAAVEGREVAATAAGGDGWQIAVPVPVHAAAMRLVDRTFSRLVALTPIIDAPPTVELTAPARDSTLRAAEGQVTLVANATDDIGLADGYFEVIVTAGEEESGGVHGRTLTIGQTSLGDKRSATLTATLSFSTLGLHPGDVISMRAVARDGNVVTGPGIGTSDTRTFRLATPQEYDTVNVTPAPTSVVDSAYMTQKMIVIATRALLDRMRRQPPLRRDSVVHSAARLADREEALRARVYELLSSDVSMPRDERRLFDTAYAAMSDASTSLEVAEVREALPPELRALGALDSVRAMQRRYYLRGQPPVIVVNIARVRLTGTDSAHAGARLPSVPVDTVERRLGTALSRLGGRDMADSLAVMQVAAYGVSPALAASFGEAAAAVRAGRDPAPALARARRLLNFRVRVDTARAGWLAP